MYRHHPIAYDYQRVIIMDRGDYTTCTVVLKGASITSWKIHHEEQIFMSRISYIDDYNKYRGGITLVFPHYDIWNKGRQHGFARDLMWRVSNGPLTKKNGDVYVELSLPSDKFTKSNWNFDFELRYRHHPIAYGDPRVVVMDRGDYTTCTILLRGASIISWKIHHEEQIFIGKFSRIDDYSKYRGGITQAFPHYDSWNFGRQHGFARDLIWRIRSGPDTMENGDVILELFLLSDKYTKSNWNYDFELRYSILLKPKSLETRIVVINTSLIYSFKFYFEQHWCIKFKDKDKCTLSGLKGCSYINRRSYFHKTENEFKWIKQYAPLNIQTEEEYSLAGRLHRLYKNTPLKFSINNEVENKKIVVTNPNLNDLNLWNPGEIAHKIDDLDVDEVKYFVVFDSGNLVNSMSLEPNTFWCASQTFEVMEMKETKAKWRDFYEYFEGYC